MHDVDEHVMHIKKIKWLIIVMGKLKSLKYSFKAFSDIVRISENLTKMALKLHISRIKFKKKMFGSHANCVLWNFLNVNMCKKAEIK